MVASRQKFFTTEQVTALLGLAPEDKWRVTKFVQSREYGIRPSVSEAAGPGSRRLYDVENVCEIGLALRLLETGLRPKVIGHLLKELRQDGKLSRKLKIDKDVARALYLGIFLSSQIGKPLDSSRIQYVDFFEGFLEVEHVLERIEEGLTVATPGLAKLAELPRFRNLQRLIDPDVLLVAVGLMFYGINERLAAMEAESAGGKP